MFASSIACAETVRNHIAENQKQVFDLVLVDEDPQSRRDSVGLPPLISELFGADCFYAENVEKLPSNVGDITLGEDIDTSVLLSVSKMVWFRHWTEPITPDRGDGSWICGTYITIGSHFGLPLECYEEDGTPVPSPIQDIFAELMKDEFAAWQESRREYTEKLKSTGLRLIPHSYASLIYGVNGDAIDIGYIELPLEVSWRLRRLERWAHSHDPREEWPEEDQKLCATEVQACAELLRRELKTSVEFNLD